MKQSILVLVLFTNSSLVFSQLDDANSSNNGSMTLGSGTGTLYQFAGDQKGTDTTNQSQGGFGILSGSNQISPIIWMYGSVGRNAFQVIRKGYNSTVQNSSTLFHIGEDGKTGIGTTAPSTTLYVKHLTDQIVSTFESGDPGNYINITDSNSGTFGAMIGVIGDDLLLSPNNVERLRIVSSSGNVGIGTTNPLSKLSVNGHIRATEVKVLANVSVPDYVFESNYELRTLKDTKEFIVKNKHLPEIPSAAEIEENGIELGDMNMRLLKKIEELTLYQIELMEQMEEMKKELQDLKD